MKNLSVDYFIDFVLKILAIVEDYKKFDSDLYIYGRALIELFEKYSYNNISPEEKEKLSKELLDLSKKFILSMFPLIRIREKKNWWGIQIEDQKIPLLIHEDPLVFLNLLFSETETFEDFTEMFIKVLIEHAESMKKRKKKEELDTNKSIKDLIKPFNIYEDASFILANMPEDIPQSALEVLSLVKHVPTIPEFKNLKDLELSDNKVIRDVQMETARHFIDVKDKLEKEFNSIRDQTSKFYYMLVLKTLNLFFGDPRICFVLLSHLVMDLKVPVYFSLENSNIIIDRKYKIHLPNSFSILLYRSIYLLMQGEMVSNLLDKITSD